MLGNQASSMNDHLFVGRAAEVAKFREMLEVREGPWLLWIVGPGGQGKTALLHRLLRLCEERQLDHSGIVDFFNVELHTKFGLVLALAERFDVLDDPTFQEARQEYQDEHSRGDEADEDVVRHAQTQMEDALIESIRPLRRHANPKVILLDTIERIASADLAKWLFCELLPRLVPFFRVVAAGRKLPAQCVQDLQDEAVRVDLEESQLDRTEVRDYFERAGLPPVETLAGRVYELSGGEGQPLLLALAVDALRDGYLNPAELETMTRDDFERRLVDDPAALSDTEHRVILVMAHAFHRMDPPMLRALYSSADLGVSDYHEFLKRLAEFKFVKYRSDVKTATLHDYFSDRLRQRYWAVEDPDLAVRAQLSSDLVRHYEQRLKEIEGNGKTNLPLIDTLRYERLYHLLYADRERAYGEFWDLLDRSWHLFKYDYMDSLLGMMRWFNEEQETLLGSFDKVLDRLERAARAWMYLETWRLQEARDLAEGLIHDPAGMRRIQLTAVVAKATALGWLGDTDEALRLLWDAYEGYEDLLSLVEAAEQGVPETEEQVQGEHGVATVHGIQPERYLILNTIGVFERRRGRLEEAEEAFRQSFDLSRSEGDRGWMASAATQLGRIRRYRGDYTGANDFVRFGLEERRRLNQPGRLAFSLYNMGMLRRAEGQFAEARRRFEQAIEIWDGLGAEFDLAAAVRDVGWLDTLEGHYDEAEERFAQAEEAFDRLGIGREFPNLRLKQGRLWIAKAQEAQDEHLRSEHLYEAERLLSDGLGIAERYEDALFAANCLVDLCRVVLMRGQYERVSEWAERVRAYEAEGYEFLPAYANLEFVEAEVAYEGARLAEADFDVNLLDEAADHYCQAYIYLARYQDRRYLQRLDRLRDWLTELPNTYRQREAQRLIECWKSHKAIASRHPDFVQTCSLLGGLQSGQFFN